MPLMPVAPQISLGDISYTTKEKIHLIVQGIAIPIILFVGAVLNLVAGALYASGAASFVFPVSLILPAGLAFTALGVYLVCSVVKKIFLFERQIHSQVIPLIDYTNEINQLPSKEKEALKAAKNAIEAYWLESGEKVIQELKGWFPLKSIDVEIFDTLKSLDEREGSYQKVGGNYYYFFNLDLEMVFNKVKGNVKKKHLALSVNGLVVITETKKRESFALIHSDTMERLKKSCQSNTVEGGILPVFDSQEVMGTQWIVHPMCNGTDLLESEIFFTKENRKVAKSIVRGLFNAVKALHENELAHHDICLENVFLHRTDEKVMTFLGDHDLMHRQISSDMNEALRNFYRNKKKVEGDYRYRAPEFFLKEEFDCLKQDVWSLGIVLIFLLVPSDRKSVV